MEVSNRINQAVMLSLPASEQRNALANLAFYLLLAESPAYLLRPAS
jgi:hypothetical protein